MQVCAEPAVSLEQLEKSKLERFFLKKWTHGWKDGGTERLCREEWGQMAGQTACAEENEATTDAEVKCMGTIWECSCRRQEHGIIELVLMTSMMVSMVRAVTSRAS